jgi:hypothetical protein
MRGGKTKRKENKTKYRGSECSETTQNSVTELPEVKMPDVTVNELLTPQRLSWEPLSCR